MALWWSTFENFYAGRQAISSRQPTRWGRGGGLLGYAFSDRGNRFQNFHFEFNDSLPNSENGRSGAIWFGPFETDRCGAVLWSIL